MRSYLLMARVVALGIVSVGGAGGCGSKGSLGVPVCTPACPNGAVCTEEGCVAQGAVLDLAMSAGNDGQADPCAGACNGTTPRCNPNGVCVACLADGDCPQGMVCRNAGSITICAQGCNDSSRCGTNAQGAPKACCGGACIDTGSDPSNCGGCGNACQGQHASAVCIDGACMGDKCDPSWGDCNSDPSDGCETNFHVDTENCGKCGAVCKLPAAISRCADGTCYVASCQFGFDDCDADSTNGCERNIVNDNRNCGACGKACNNPPHARSACINASCQLTTCDQGFADCDANPANGCEVGINADPSNCGGCRLACGQGLVCRNGGCTCPQCDIPNASSKCVNNVCVLDKCVDGFADCNGDPKDGCESPVAYDKKNCGACNNVCPMDQVCLNSKCSVCNGNILVIGDDQAQANADLVAAINNAGMHGEVVPNGSITYAGNPDPNNYGAVVILIGNNYGSDLPAAGQQALIRAQGNATGLVTSEWFAYEIMSGRYQQLAPALLYQRTSGTTSILTYAKEMAHVIWNGLPDNFKTVNSMGANTGMNLVNGGVRIAGCAECQGAGVAVRDDQKGRVVQFSFAADYTAGGAGGAAAWKNDANLTQLVVNAIKWAAKCI